MAVVIILKILANFIVHWNYDNNVWSVAIIVTKQLWNKIVSFFWFPVVDFISSLMKSYFVMPRQYVLLLPLQDIVYHHRVPLISDFISWLISSVVQILCFDKRMVFI